MQCAKDSFYMALRERLAALNPSRVATIAGASRPAVAVVENELPSVAMQLPETFYLQWGDAVPADPHTGERMLMKMECVVSYFTVGQSESEVDRGRTLGELDQELLSICQPTRTGKQDFTRSPSVDMGTNVFWSLPEIHGWKANSQTDSNFSRPAAGLAVQAARAAKINVYFFPEVTVL